ncbi:hypothetical protein GCM10020000_65170 [Streptomyces olivoverticillatus]
MACAPLYDARRGVCHSPVPDPYPGQSGSGKLPAMSFERARYDRATGHLDAPLAVVDLRAFDANADDLVRRAHGKPVRIATKSVRCRALLERVLARDGFAGVMAHTLAEALWLARSGVEDVLLAYPSADRSAFAELTSDAKLARAVTVMVDDPAQLAVVDAARAGREEVRVCLELDTSLRLLGGRARIGALRSPLRTPERLAELARLIDRRPGFRLVGLMAYEAHVAGVGDAVAGRPLRSAAVRLMQAAARRELAARRAEAVRAVRAVAELEFVNGGGTGSVQHTAAEPTVTEVAAGSGLFVPRLFDDFRSFTGRPAALFALPVVRRPGLGVVTVLGGGYPASGVPGRDRLPVPYLLGRAAVRAAGGRGRGADAAARARGGRPPHRRQGVVPACEGGRDVRALRGAAPRGRRPGDGDGAHLPGRGPHISVKVRELRA